MHFIGYYNKYSSKTSESGRNNQVPPGILTLIITSQNRSQ